MTDTPIPDWFFLAADYVIRTSSGVGTLSSHEIDNLREAIARAIMAADKAATERAACTAIKLGALHFDDCTRLGFMDPETGQRECSMRDCLCAYREETGEEIAAAIRKEPT